MSTPAADNPFSPAAHGARGGPPVPSAVWRAFAVRRGIRLLVLPTMLGLLTAVARQDLALPAWSIIAMTLGSASLWLPTSVWMAWARFLRPHDDDHGLLITTGEVLDRAAFLHVVAARSVEVGLVLLAMWSMCLLFWLSFGWLWALPVGLICAVVSAWGGLRLHTQVCTARAAVRLAGGQLERARTAVEQGLRLAAGRRTSDTLRALQVAILLRSGQPGAARQSLGRMSDPRWMNTDLIREMLALEEGNSSDPQVEHEQAENLVRAFALARLRALAALYADRPADALAAIAPWTRTRAWMPQQHLQLVDLLEAAAHVLNDDPADARAALVRSRATPQDRAWIARSHPRWHAWLESIPASDPAPRR